MNAAPVIPLAQALAIDAAMEADKQPLPGRPLVDGYEARRQARALQLQIQSQNRFSYFQES